MTSFYYDQGSATETPIEVEIITDAGERLGYLGRCESTRLTFNLHAADIIEITAPLDSLTAKLTDTTGQILLCASYRGMRIIATPSDYDIQALSGDPSSGEITVTAQGNWQFFDGTVLAPAFRRGWGLALSAPERSSETNTWSTVGPVSDVIRDAVRVRSAELTLPIVVAANTGSGPDAVLMWEWQKLSDGIKDILPNTSHYVDVRSLAPGDMSPDGAVGAQRPTVWVDVKPYRRRDIIWTVEGGDVTDWSMQGARATTNQLYSIFRPEGHPNKSDAPGWWSHSYLIKASSSKWNLREDVYEWQYPDDQPRLWSDLLASEVFELMDKDARAVHAQKAVTTDIDASIDATYGWTFGPPEEEGARVFSLGDIVKLELPAGNFTSTVMSVEVEQTPTSFTVTPTVAKQSAKSMDTFDLTADLQKRVMLLERGAR